MVIDDSRAMRKILRRTLEQQGFEVVEAGDGQEALDIIAAEGAPELALVDWNMPVMDGLTFVTTLRSTPGYRDVTLMMVTTESEYSQIVRALSAGAHEYLLKPFTREALVEKLAILTPVLACAPQLRSAVRRMVEPSVARLPVVSYTELSGPVQIRSIGVVSGYAPRSAPDPAPPGRGPTPDCRAFNYQEHSVACRV